MFQPFIWSCVGFGEGALVSFMVPFSEVLGEMWRMVKSGLSVTWSPFHMTGVNLMGELRSRRRFFPRS